VKVRYLLNEKLKISLKCDTSKNLKDNVIVIFPYFINPTLLPHVNCGVGGALICE
jgi:hypothetical protein